MSQSVFNIKIAGLGGMGVLSAAHILAQAAFLSGHDVKKAEVHGMSQRGGSVASDIRFGLRVLSPMIPPGEVDFLLALAPEWTDLHRPELRAGGRLIVPGDIDAARLPSKRAINVAMLGVLSRCLPLPAEHWLAALDGAFPGKLHASNREAFRLGAEQ
jgi:indolepyruvate ferredoxin oxidoreductase beta subunit